MVTIFTLSLSLYRFNRTQHSIRSRHNVCNCLDIPDYYSYSWLCITACSSCHYRARFAQTLALNCTLPFAWLLPQTRLSLFNDLPTPSLYYSGLPAGNSLDPPFLASEPTSFTASTSKLQGLHSDTVACRGQASEWRRRRSTKHRVLQTEIGRAWLSIRSFMARYR